MDGPSQVLDVGRATRTVNTAQWNALVARDQHCTHPGCTRPPAYCDAHHIIHWTRGGPTNLANLSLLCWEHHRKQHLHDASHCNANDREVLDVAGHFTGMIPV